MATVLIRNGILAGAVAGFQSGRLSLSFTPTDYTLLANTADALAAECIVRNAALGVPMADADNAQIGQLCHGAAMGACNGVAPSSITAADYIAMANQIVASAKQCAAKLV